MKHLNLEVEKLEERIATWISPIDVGIGVGSGSKGGSKASCGCNGS